MQYKTYSIQDSVTEKYLLLLKPYTYTQCYYQNSYITTLYSSMYSIYIYKEHI